MRRKRRVSALGVAFALLVGLVVFFFLRLSLHRPPPVALPTPEQTEQSGEVAPKTEQEALRRVEVTPLTVQLVIERLARPENYSRTILFERFWRGTSGVGTASVSADGGWTRVDQTNRNGETRHSITSAEESWIWYGESDSVYRGAASVSADEEQSIPTYEDILRLDTAEISAADYRSLDGVSCIYVETVPDGDGYVNRYFIAVGTGLLASMERLRDGETIYRMTALGAERDTVGAAAFTLPDGTVLHDPGTNENGENEGA